MKNDNQQVLVTNNPQILIEAVRAAKQNKSYQNLPALFWKGQIVELLKNRFDGINIDQIDLLSEEALTSAINIAVQDLKETNVIYNSEEQFKQDIKRNQDTEKIRAEIKQRTQQQQAQQRKSAAQKQSTFMESAQAAAKRQVQTQVVDKPTFVVAPEEPEVVRQQQLRQQARQVFGQQEVIYVKTKTKPQPIVLNTTEVKFVKEEAEKIKRDPVKYVKKLAEKINYQELPQEIQVAIPEAEFELHKKVAAARYATKISGLSDKLEKVQNQDSVQVTPSLNTTWLINHLAEQTKSPPIGLTAKSLAINRAVHAFVDEKIAGPNLSTVFNGRPEKADFETTSTPQGAIPINITQLSSFSEKYYTQHEERETDSDAEQDYLQLLRRIDWKSFFKKFSWQKTATGISDIFSTAFESPALLPATITGGGAMAGYYLTSPALFSSWEAAGLLQTGGAGGQFAGLLGTGEELLTTEVLFFEGGKVTAVASEVIDAPIIASTAASSSMSFVEGELVGEAVATAGGTALSTSTAAGVDIVITGGAATAGSTAGAAAGSIVPIIGTVIGAVVGLVVGWLTSQLPKIKKRFEENPIIGPILVGLGGLVMLGGSVVVGGVAVLGGLGATAMSSGGSLAASLSSIPINLFGATRNILSMSLSEIGKPIIITFITLPFVVAAIMVIINTGAYIVPTSQDSTTGGGGGPVANGSCPIPSGVVTCGSLGSGSTAATTKCEHGTLAYWNGVVAGGGKMCQWGLPSSDGSHGANRCGTSPLNNTPCYSSSSQCKNSDGTVVYGYAADIRYPNQGACNASLQVYFPSLNGQILHWKKFLSFDNAEANGANGVYMAEDGTNVYEMYVTHLDSVVAEGDSGQPIGSLSCGLDYPHVHIEIRINGDFIRPDTLCTGDSATNVGGSCTAPGPYEDGTEPADLTTLNRNYSARDDTQISSSIESRLIQFINYARSQGYDLYVYLGYRTYEEQKLLCVDCNNKKQSNPNYPCLAAPASQSKHRTGRAVDMYIGGNLGSVTNMINDAKIKAKMQELGVNHPISSDPPHFEL